MFLQSAMFSEMAEELLAGLAGKSLAPTFAFLDPFGPKDVPLELINRLLSFKRCELFIYFDFNSVQRFATSGQIDDVMTSLYGTDRFKDAPQAGDPGRKPFLHNLYQEQLQKVCGFDHVQSFEMVTNGTRTGYYLFFCTRNLKGLDLMKQAMWRVAPSGDFKYSDQYAGQTVLFEEDVDTEPLKRDLLEHFAGQLVSVQAVIDYTIARTPFCSNHVKRRTLVPLQREDKITSPNQQRRGQFPDGTLIQF